MARRRDPVEEAADDGQDLYDVATWERRTALDRFSALVYRLLLVAGRVVVVLTALGILVAQFALGGLGATARRPEVIALVVLSVVPALFLAAWVWRSDVTDRQPLHLLVVTFLLGVLFAMFAAVTNGLFGTVFDLLPAVAGTTMYFYVVVAPVEETVKLLAVRLHAFRSESFGSVVDGAVYGATAGLGFATIENYLYITRTLESTEAGVALVGAAGGITAARALAGPGHVIYSAIAGYYLGLAKFNGDDAGPIVVKGLLLAAFVHGTYNVLVGPVSGVLSATLVWAEYPWVGYVAFVVAYDGLFGLFVYRKLRAYARAYREAHESDSEDSGDPVARAETTEFDP